MHICPCVIFAQSRRVTNTFPCLNSEEAKSTTWLHPVSGEAVITGHRKTPGKVSANSTQVSLLSPVSVVMCGRLAILPTRREAGCDIRAAFNVSGLWAVSWAPLPRLVPTFLLLLSFFRFFGQSGSWREDACLLVNLYKNDFYRGTSGM